MRRLDDMHAWAQRACGNDRYATSTRTKRRADGMPTEILRVHFADETIAAAFAREFVFYRRLSELVALTPEPTDTRAGSS
jgi:hypothetical protein